MDKEREWSFNLRHRNVAQIFVAFGTLIIFKQH